MNYHAHIPAGVAFAAGACLITHSPLSIPMLIAGGVGGALPDIDHPSGNAAVSSLGSKAGNLVQSATKGRVTIFKKIGSVCDIIFLKPAVHLWLLFAQYVLSPIYMQLYESFGCNIGWDNDDPSKHRGGLTHSIVFLIVTSLIIFPITNFLLHDNLILAGLALGILSHLFADSVCKSGIKWFWPWLPKFGFWDDTHEKGNGIRLLPVNWCMSTGKCQTRTEYLELGRGTKRYREMKKAYYKEKGWQWGFKTAMILLIFCCVTGILGGSGIVAWGQSQFATSPIGSSQIRTLEMHKDAVKTNVISSIADKKNYSNSTDKKNVQSEKIKIGEHQGPTSLTYGDIDFAELPKGIIKLPDETLWVVGVGQVSSQTLESPSLMITKDEKNKLLIASTAQRLKDIPSGASEAINKATEGVKNVANDTGNTMNNAKDAAKDATSDFNKKYNQQTDSDSNSVTDILSKMLGDSGSGNGFGFMGLTPYTKNK